MATLSGPKTNAICRSLPASDACSSTVPTQRSIPDEPSEPQKMLLTKWTAVKPVAKQKHFLVRKVIQPELPTDPIELVEIEAVFFKATQIIAWRQLQDDKVWRQGWV